MINVILYSVIADDFEIQKINLNSIIDAFTK